MSALKHYLHMQDRKELSYQQYNYAGAKLEIESIKCRLAEIESQANPIDSLLLARLNERERLCAIAFYVVIGRFPAGLEIPVADSTNKAN